MNSREKGKRGERQWRDELRANGYMARRGQQFAGSPDSPDVVCPDLAGIHFEVKAVERLNIYDAMEQARRDCRRQNAECRMQSGERNLAFIESASGWVRCDGAGTLTETVHAKGKARLTERRRPRGWC